MLISNAKGREPGTVKGRLINSLRVKQPLMVGQNAKAMGNAMAMQGAGIAWSPPTLRIGGGGWSVMVPESPTPTPGPPPPSSPSLPSFAGYPNFLKS